jgi:tetrahydrodipicolinate N-succinyltransferase
MTKSLSIGTSVFFGVLALGVVVRLGSEALAVIMGVLLGVMAIIPFGLILLAATKSNSRSSERAVPPVVILGGGMPAPDYRQKLPPQIYQPWDEPDLLPMPEREFHIVGEK